MTPKEFQLDIILKVHLFLKNAANFKELTDEAEASFEDWMVPFLDFLGYTVKEEES